MLGYWGWTNVIRGRCDYGRKEQRDATMPSLRNGKTGHEPGDKGSLEDGNDKKVDSSLVPLEINTALLTP